MDETLQTRWAKAQTLLKATADNATLHPALFNARILKDEVTGGPIKLAPMHLRWHELLSDHDRAIIWSHVEAGKTQQVTIGRVLYELGKNHNLRIAVVSNTAFQAQKVIRTIAQYIEKSPELRRATGLRPAEGLPWTSTQLYVERATRGKDPSVQACGVHGAIVGSRVDLLILDDVLDFENCRTEKAREELYSWYLSALAGRLTKGARVWVVGTAYHPGDLMHKLARTPGWVARRFPVLNPTTGESNWPQQWPLERINKVRLTDMSAIEFARQMLCVARSDLDAHFKAEWIDKCKMRGLGRKLAWTLQHVPPGCKTVTGVDLGVQPKDSADLTVFFTLIFHPNADREVLDITAGRWSGPDIVSRVVDIHNRYKSLVIVENNAAQDFIVQFAPPGAEGRWLRGYTTGRNKAHPEFGIEGIATEMEHGKWLIPNDRGTCHPEVEAWCNEMLYYDPAAHTGDRLMASWLAREGHRLAAVKNETFTQDFLRR